MKAAGYYLRSAKHKDPMIHQDAMWTDDEVKEIIEQAQKDAYNQALLDAGLSARVECVLVKSGYNPEYRYRVDPHSILKLKKQ